MARRKFETTGKGDSRIVSIQTQGNGVCDNKMFFADRLKMHRTIARISQIELAERLNLSRGAIANWESGRTRPDIANIPALCDVLGISIGEFFCNSPDMAPTNSDESMLLFNYRHLCLAHRKVLLSVSDQLLTAEEDMADDTIIDLVQLPLAEDSVAAGVNMADFSAHCKPVFLHSSPAARRADMIFQVNGDSMEPEYPNHSYVLIKRDEAKPQYGEVGIFQVDNSLYIKEFRKEGLHSLNPRWPLMNKKDYGSIRFVGRVIGVISPDEFATSDEIRAFTKNN